MWTVNSVSQTRSDDILTDIALCRDTIRTGSRSFFAASRLLPSEVRDGAYALYAFCRVSDDAVDLGRNPARALSQLRFRLGRAYDGNPLPRPVDRAFARLVRQYDIPLAIPEALLEGFEWDVDGRTYNTLDDLLAYAARVASTVGVMMALVMGVRDRPALTRACQLGLAMQLTNIARDIGEDARAGRCYLPTQWLEEAGVSRCDLSGPGPANAKVRGLTLRLLDEASVHYAAGLAGTRYLPRNCRPAIVAAGRIYAGIGAQIARNGYDSLSQRARVSAPRKLAHLVGAFAWPRTEESSDTLADRDETRFLVEAAARRPVPEVAVPADIGRAAWLIELFARLELRDRHLQGRLHG